jgi:hypothetical protein
MPIAIAILGVLILGVLVGSLLNPAVGIGFGLLILLMVPAVFLGREHMLRQRRILQMKRFRREAQAQKTDFRPEDKRTMV